MPKVDGYEFRECVGCGYCCLKVTCDVGYEYHRVSGKTYPCPSLRWSGKRYVCDLAERYKIPLSIGEGCSSSLNTWRKDVKERRENNAI